MRLLLLLVLFAVAFLAGCASLRSFEEIRREVAPDRFLRIGDQLVHVEQTGSGEPVVLLHGFGGSVYSSRRECQPFPSKKGWHFCPDPG